MSEDLFELEATDDRDDLAAVFAEIADALEADRPIALETDEHRLSVAVPPRVEAEFELEREREIEDEGDGDEDDDENEGDDGDEDDGGDESDADGDNGDDASRLAELEFEIELEWDAPVDDSGVTVEPRGDDGGGRDAGEGEEPTGSAPAERDESEPDDDRDSLLLPAEAFDGGGDAGADDDGDSTSSGRQSRFEVYRDRADQWRWRLVHWNGNVVADSGEGYASRSNVERAARGVMDTAPAARIERVEADG